MPASPGPVVVTDFDHHSDHFAQQPFETLAALRSQAPIVWSTSYDGFWVVTEHQRVLDGLADYRTFSSTSGPAIPANAFGTRHIPVALDPPDHRVYRKVLNSHFSKETITRLEPQIRALVESLVLGLADKGEWDFVTDLGEVSPGAVSLSILGWNPERRAELLGVMAYGLRNQANADPVVVAKKDENNRWLRAQIVAEANDRRDHPGEDLMTVLATEPIADGHVLSDEEISDTVVLLLLAGFHTTSGAFTSLLVQMEKDPELRRHLTKHRELIPDAIEETVRIYSPAAAHARRVTDDIEFGGVTMRKGDWTLFVNMAANHDPAAFDNAGEFELGRNRSKSVGFGWGVHRCLGLHLARAILRIEVETVFDLMPDYTIDLDRIVRSDHMGLGYFYLSIPASRAKAAS